MLKKMEFSSLTEDFLVKFGDIFDRKFAEHLAGVKEDGTNDEGGSDNIEGKNTGVDAVVLLNNAEAEQYVEERTCDELCRETSAIEKEFITACRFTEKELCATAQIWKQPVLCSYQPHRINQKSDCKFKARILTCAAVRIGIYGRVRATRKGPRNHRHRKKRRRWKPSFTKPHKHTSGVCQPL